MLSLIDHQLELGRLQIAVNAGVLNVGYAEAGPPNVPSIAGTLSHLLIGGARALYLSSSTTFAATWSLRPHC
jgi:hypothetical protein